MANAKQFCALESVQAGDPLPGTATHAEKNLLLSWPRQTWTRNLRHARDMSPELIEGLDDLVAHGRRVNLIYRRDRTEHTHRVLLFPEGQAFEITPRDLQDFLADVRQGRELDHWQPTAENRPVMLCCTHGKKDKCCARFGYATYRQLQTVIHQEQLPVDLWESSHLGGCRLAASVLMLPSRRKYGRVTEEQVGPLLHHELDGRPYLPCYRGNGGHTPAQQCAETAALEHLSKRLPDRHVILEVDNEESGAGGSTVRVSWNNGETRGSLVADCRVREVLRVDTCADLDEGPTPSMCWYVHAIEAEPDGNTRLETTMDLPVA